MNLLTSMAMAVLRIQRLFPAELELDFPAMAASLVADMEIRVVVVDGVWRTMLPGVEFTFGVTWITIVAVGAVGRGVVWGHCAG